MKEIPTLYEHPQSASYRSLLSFSSFFACNGVVLNAAAVATTTTTSTNEDGHEVRQSAHRLLVDYILYDITYIAYIYWVLSLLSTNRSGHKNGSSNSKVPKPSTQSTDKQHTKRNKMETE